jgi:hypothetical protein
MQAYTPLLQHLAPISLDSYRNLIFFEHKMQEKNKSQFYAEYALCTWLTFLQFSTYFCVLCSVATYVTQEPK